MDAGPRIHAATHSAGFAMQNAAIRHPRKFGIARKQVLQHLSGVVKVLLAQVHAQPCHLSENDVVGDPQMRHSRSAVARRLRAPRQRCRNYEPCNE